MRKILYSTFLVLLLFTMTIAPDAKAADTVRMVDGANLLTDAEELEIETQLDAISAKYDADIVIVTSDTLAGMTPKEYANYVYKEVGKYQMDGMIFLVCMEYRDYYILPEGRCDISIVTKDGATYIGDKVQPKLSDGDYAAAFEKYISLTDKFFDKQARTGTPYDGSNMPKDMVDYLKAMGIALIIGLVIAFLIVNSMRAKLKSVAPNPSAADYMRPGSMNVSDSNDMFLYRTVNRRARPKSSSSGGGGGRSSGGGGAGGKF